MPPPPAGVDRPPDVQPYPHPIDDVQVLDATTNSRTRSAAFIPIAVSASVVLLISAFLGYQTWKNMFREVPQPAFVSDADHFKYAPIGLGKASTSIPSAPLPPPAAAEAGPAHP